MLVLSLYLTQCERRFHLFVLENNVSFSDDGEYARKLESYCARYEGYDVRHPMLGKSAAVVSVRTAAGVSAIIDESSPENADLATYNRIALNVDAAECSISNYAAYSDTIGRVEDLPDRFQITSALPSYLFLGEYGLLHKSYDQGTCGSCYAFASRLIFHALMKWNEPFYKQLKTSSKIYDVFSPIFNDYSKLLSVQFILNNTHYQGINRFCAGGTFEDVLYYFLRDPKSTQELNANFPYEFMLHSEEELEDTAVKITPRIAYNAYVNPFYWYRTINGCPSGALTVEADEFTKGWNESQIAVIKTLLAHGIPLAGQMHFNGSGDKRHMMAFYNYKSGVVPGGCVQDISNHQVTLVGYGTHKGVPVWVFQNSWGASWGQHGFYYVKIGSNAMCHETKVIAAFPRFFRYNTADRKLKFTDTTNYKNNLNIFANTFAKLIYRGYNGLDYDDGSFEDSKISWAGALMVLIMLILCLFAFYHLLVSQCCPPELAVKPAMYVRITAEEAMAIDWSSSCVRRKN